MNGAASLRLIDDPPARGSWNMAVDQALLMTANELGRPTLRVYRWRPATLSLGYFQRYEERLSHVSSRHCDVVRRSSGGGAILHDQELTYSLCLPARNRWSEAHGQLYRKVHEMLVELLANRGVSAALYGDGGDTPPETGGQDEMRVSERAFLCFQRRTTGDLTQAGWKIGGSAQRRGEQALIQHGSLLLRRSEFAPELPGITDLSEDFDLSLFVAEFAEKFARRVAGMLNVELEQGKLSESERKTALQVEAERFAHSSWTKKR